MKKPTLIKIQEKSKVKSIFATATLFSGLIFISGLAALIVTLSQAETFQIATAGNTYVVSPSGNDATGDGTAQNPLATIGKAATLTSPGDTVIVLAGDYRSREGQVEINRSGQASALITFQANGQVITRGFKIMANYIILNGFDITSTGSDQITGPGIVLNGNSCQILNNHVYGATRQGIWLYGEYNDTKNCLVQNNIVENSGTGNYGDGNGILIFGAYTQNNTINNNQVFNNAHTGIAIYKAANNLVSANKIYQNKAAGIHVGDITSSGNIIEKNEVYENCQKLDDVFGIDLLQVGNNNIVRYNKVHNQHDTLNDSSVGPNPGNPAGSPKYGTGGIRFDGGMPNTNNWNAAGNQAYYNIVYGENTGFSVLNHNNVRLLNNTVYNIGNSALLISAYNTNAENNANLDIRNNIFRTAKNMVELIAYENQSYSLPIFNNNIYSATSPNFLWGTRIRFTYQGQQQEIRIDENLSFDQWKNSNLSPLSTGWQRLGSGNIWFLAKSKNPAMVYFNGAKGVRKIITDETSLEQALNAPLTWTWMQAGGIYYLAVYATDNPANLYTNGGVMAYYTELTNQDLASLTSNPLFKNPPADFSLQAGSPAVNQGANLGLSPDFFGVAVPQNSQTDMGAAEYTTGPICGNGSCETGETCSSCASDCACPAGQICENNSCITSCVPKTCTELNKQCGDWNDGCNGTLNCGPAVQTCSIPFGTCLVTGNQTCNNGQYTVCDSVDPRLANCTDKQCGSDNCGGSCGTCPAGQTCLADSTCCASSTYYRDADGDGYGNKSITVSACGQPAGYVTNNTDCNDNNASLWRNLTGYTDNDKDTYGYGSSKSICSGNSLPVGYATNNKDCCDSAVASASRVTTSCNCWIRRNYHK